MKMKSVNKPSSSLKNKRFRFVRKCLRACSSAGVVGFLILNRKSKRNLHTGVIKSTWTWAIFTWEVFLGSSFCAGRHFGPCLCVCFPILFSEQTGQKASADVFGRAQDNKEAPVVRVSNLCKNNRNVNIKKGTATNHRCMSALKPYILTNYGNSSRSITHGSSRLIRMTVCVLSVETVAEVVKCFGRLGV